MTGAPKSLAERMAVSASGYGAVIDGVLNIRTVTDSRKSAALNALLLSGFNIVTPCQDPDCDCVERAMAKIMPSARLVAVSVEVSE